MAISWAYIAGFFDGDGTVTTSERMGTRVHLYQSGDIGHFALQKMGQFLNEEGIAWSFSSLHRGNPKWKTAHNLAILRQSDVTLFLQKVHPWIRTRKEKVGVLLGDCDSKPVNWEYISGLFDAEGYWTRIGIPNSNGDVQYSGWGMGMTGEASRDALEEIRDFIADQGVTVPKVYRCDPSRKGMKDVFKLQANSRAAAILIGNKILPYLIIKKTFVQDAIRYLTMFPRKPSTPNGKLSHPKLIEEYKGGLTLKQIAKKYELDYSGVWKTFTRIQSAYL